MAFAITNIHPGAGNAGDPVIITVEFEPQGADKAVPQIDHVLFSHTEATVITMLKVDKEACLFEFRTTVPLGARTGKIQVDLDGLPTIESHHDFTVQADIGTSLRITRVNPVQPTSGYRHGDRLRIDIDGINSGIAPDVFFARTENGPPTLRPTLLPIWTQSGANDGELAVRVPADAKTGRIKVEFPNSHASALSPTKLVIGA
jgi:hypothetical protein